MGGEEESEEGDLALASEAFSVRTDGAEAAAFARSIPDRVVNDDIVSSRSHREREQDERQKVQGELTLDGLSPLLARLTAGKVDGDAVDGQ